MVLVYTLECAYEPERMKRGVGHAPFHPIQLLRKNHVGRTLVDKMMKTLFNVEIFSGHHDK